jgi:plastocyanin/uncharacterized membrane protein YozB (DUF420 family)
VPGFLGGNATFAADLNIVAQILMGLMLLGGMVLARAGRFRAHAVCQSTVVLLNLIPIGLFMAPAFRGEIAPGLPDRVGQLSYALPAAHATLGGIAEILALYILLSAGTRLLPRALRFTNYKVWMRSTISLWWVVVIIGLASYAASYLAPGATKANIPVPLASPDAPEPVGVDVRNFVFEPNELTVMVGTTVIWTITAGRHTVTADDRTFDSPTILTTGEQFTHTFDTEGVFPFYCELHGSPGGADMAAVIRVVARPP